MAAQRKAFRVDWKEVACNVALLVLIPVFVIFTFGM